MAAHSFFSSRSLLTPECDPMCVAGTADERLPWDAGVNVPWGVASWPRVPFLVQDHVWGLRVMPWHSHAGLGCDTHTPL